MTNRIYPRQVWVLKPSFKPVEETVVKPYGTWTVEDYGDLTKEGRQYMPGQMYETKEAAIEAGYLKCDELEKKLSKQAADIYKRRSALQKASEE